METTADKLARVYRIRRATTNADILAICEDLSRLLYGSRDAEVKPSRDAGPSRDAECPVCAARKTAEAARARKSRQKAKQCHIPVRG